MIKKLNKKKKRQKQIKSDRVCVCVCVREEKCFAAGKRHVVNEKDGSFIRCFC